MCLKIIFEMDVWLWASEGWNYVFMKTCGCLEINCFVLFYSAYFFSNTERGSNTSQGTYNYFIKSQNSQYLF